MNNEESLAARLGVIQRLQLYLSAFLGEESTRTPEERREAFEKNVASMPEPQFTRKAAELLAQMKVNGEISDWHYVPTNHDLDRLGVDFVVDGPGGEDISVPIQVTSTPQRGWQRRKKFREMFTGIDNPETIIPVIQFKDVSLNPLSDDVVLGRMRQAFAASAKAWKNF